MAAVELLTTNINVYEDRARHPEDAVQNDDEEQEEAFSCSRFLSVLGPGFMVCLADTDGPCLITAAASGAEYGYSLVLCQIVLIPILYAAQELTVRLSLTTRKGLTELIRIHFGPNWALFACVVLVITCVAAMISEISCIVQIGKLFDIPPIVSAVLVIIVLLAIVWSNRFREVEVIGVAMGSCQLLFLIVMFMVRPQVFGSGGLIYGLAEFHFDDSGWVQLLAANIGAVIMPWMLFYQQSASCERKLTPKDMTYARADTVIEALVAQMVMIAMVIAMAATIFLKPGPKRQLRDIQEIVDAVSPTVGGTLAKVLVAVGATGASMVAALVVSITPAWSICELRGVERSHEKSYAEARGFYQGFFAILLLSGAVAIIPGFGDSAALSIQVEVLNALRMPFVVAFLFVLASKRGVLPERYRLRGWYQYLLGSVFLVCSVLCVYASILDFIEQFRGGHELRFRHTMLRRPLRDSGSVAGVEIAPVGETSESTWTGETGAHSKKGGLLANIFY